MQYLRLMLIALMCSPMSAFAQCPPGQSELIIHIVPDGWPEKISWKLYVEGVLAETGTPNSDTICVDTSACMRFEIYDTFGDGLCCDPPGSYSVYFPGDTVATGSEYTNSDIREFGPCELVNTAEQEEGPPSNSKPQSNQWLVKYSF